MKVTTYKPTTSKVARIYNAVIKVATIEDTMLKGDILKSFILRI